MSILSLHTARLELRALRVDDAVFILELLNQPSFIRNIGDRGVRDLAGATGYVDRVLASYAKHGFGMLGLEVKGGGLVGMAGLVKRDSLDAPDIGYALLESQWGQGYAREAAEVVLRHGLEAMKLPRVLGITAVDNEASMQVLRKIGMRQLGVVELPEGQSMLFTTEP